MALKFKEKKQQNISYTNQKIRLRFDKIMLNMFIGYLFCKSKNITRSNLLNLRKLFEIIDTRVYETSDDMFARIMFIRKVLEARLNQNMENQTVIINYCLKENDEEYNKIIKNIEHYNKINPQEIKFINKAVVDRLKYAYIVFYKDIFYEMFERLDIGDYDSFEEINNSVKDITVKMLSEMRRVESMTSLDTFSLGEGIMDSVVMDVVNKLKDPSKILRTGIRALNDILSPGFMSGRLYLFLGLSG